MDIQQLPLLSWWLYYCINIYIVVFVGFQYALWWFVVGLCPVVFQPCTVCVGITSFGVLFMFSRGYVVYGFVSVVFYLRIVY